METTKFSRGRLAIAFVSASLLFACVGSAAAQGLVEYDIFLAPAPAGFSAAHALGIAQSGWAPLTIVGMAVNAERKAVLWSGASVNGFEMHELWLTLSATEESWANDVMHRMVSGGEYKLVVGVREDPNDAQFPMAWDNVSNLPWQARLLPKLNAGDGEALVGVATCYCATTGSTVRRMPTENCEVERPPAGSWTLRRSRWMR